MTKIHSHSGGTSPTSLKVANLRKLSAVIGIWHRENETYYVQRSEKMQNYPSLWSLFSKQFLPDDLHDPSDLYKAQGIMDQMSVERLCGAQVKVLEHITSGTSASNPIRMHVTLHLYLLEFPTEPKLNPDFYSEGTWLTFNEFEEKINKSTCGSCTRMWWDHAWFKNWVNRPFQGQEQNS